MRTAFGFAWGNLYQAVLAMTTSTAPLPERVANAFRNHLGALNRQNTPAHVFERLRVIRARLADVEAVDDDLTIDVAPLTTREAGMIAEEIVSLYDEIAQTNGRGT